MCRGWEEKKIERPQIVFFCLLGIKCWRNKNYDKIQEKKENSLTFLAWLMNLFGAAKNPSERYHSLQQTDFTTNWILLCRSFLILLLFLFFSHLFHLFFMCCYIFCIIWSCLSVCLLGVVSIALWALIHCGSERKNQHIQ